MSSTITLPSGATATFRDPATIKYKDRKKLYEASNDKTGQLAGIAMTEAIIALGVESWSFSETAGLSLPSFNIDVLGELDIKDIDALADKANELIPVLFPATGKSEGTNPGDASPISATSKIEEPA